MKRRICIALLIASLVAAASAVAAPLQRSASPPAWALKQSDCSKRLSQRVNGIEIPSLPGEPADGYSASLLVVVARENVSCRRAKQLALDDWVNGHAGRALHWHTRRSWRSTSGSAYVGDFVGLGDGVRVEYHAIH